jgi:hypothetical protein
MDHLVIDAINKAYDDQVSRLFAFLCASPDQEKEFGDAMAAAWASRARALDIVRLRAASVRQPAGSEWPELLDPEG